MPLRRLLSCSQVAALDGKLSVLVAGPGPRGRGAAGDGVFRGRPSGRRSPRQHDPADSELKHKERSAAVPRKGQGKL